MGWDDNVINARKLVKAFQNKNIPHWLAYSGGKGLHVHVFFDSDSLTINKDVISKAKDELVDVNKTIRVALWKHLIVLAKVDKKIANLDFGKVNFSSEKKGSMIREFGTPRTKEGVTTFKTMLSEIPDDIPTPDNLVLAFPNEPIMWDVSEFSKSMETVLINQTSQYKKNSVDVSLDDINVPGVFCINRFITEGLEANQPKYYATYSIARCFHDLSLPYERAEQAVTAFLEKCNISDDERKTRHDNSLNGYDNDEHHLSCASIRGNYGDEYCSNSCEIYLKRTNAKKEEEKPQSQELKDKYSDDILGYANKILNEGDPFNFILDTWNEFHMGDKLIGQTGLISIGGTSIINTKGIHPKPSGKSGTGKSDALNWLLFLLPPERYKSGSLSSKSLFYDDSIKKGCIVCSDDQKLNEDLVDTIKQSTSKYQDTTWHRTVKKQEHSEFSIPERVTFWLASVDGLDDEQMGNRFINVDADDSEEQDERVFKKQVSDELIIENDDEVTEQVLICRAIFDIINEKEYNIKIPFAENIEWFNKNNRRNFPMFKDMVRSIALFKHRQGRTFNNVVLATVEDFYEAKHIYQQLGERNATNLTDIELKFMRWFEQERRVEIKDIMKKMNMSETTARYLMHGRDKNTPGGLLAKVPGVRLQQGSTSIKEDDSETNTTKKNIYICETNSFKINSYSDVVGIDEDKARQDFRDAVTVLTTLTPESHQNHIRITNNNKVKTNTIDIIYKNIVNNKKNDITPPLNTQNNIQNNISKNMNKSHFPEKSVIVPTDNESGMCEGCDSGVRAVTASGEVLGTVSGRHCEGESKDGIDQKTIVKYLTAFKNIGYKMSTTIDVNKGTFLHDFLQTNPVYVPITDRVISAIDHLNKNGWRAGV